MRTGRPWSGSSRRLTLLFLAVLVPPAVTLVWLGMRLLEQDRNLWAQRDLESRQSAADAVVRSLEQSVSEAERWPPGRPVPDGALRVLISSTEMRIYPPGRALWLPVPPALPNADSRGFADAERLEFQGAAQRALVRYEELARSPQAAMRAGSLLRIARVYRSSGHTAEALEAYRNLGALPRVAIDDVPADLQSRRAICALLDESHRKADLAREAAALESDFLAGRWILDRAAWELTAAQIAQWTGHALPVSPERKGLSEAAAWLWEEARRAPVSGCRMIETGAMPMTLLWRTDGSETIGFVLAPSMLRTWMQRAGPTSPMHAGLTTESGRLVVGQVSDFPRAVKRLATETGLPWTVAIDPGDASHQAGDLSARRRLLSLGLGAIVLLLAGGSYLLWRVVQRELLVARLQTNFVSAVSHEFRTPLTSLRHVTELLEENDNLAPERRKTFYAALGRSTERLHRLVESLLDFARMEVGRKPYDLQPLDAGVIAAQVVSDFRPEAAARGFTIHFDLDADAVLPLSADADALTHALWNLLDNAMKYSQEEHDVWVSVRRHPGGVAIAVRDRGLGIPRHERKEIFRRFIRGEKAKQLGIKGTGIGLAMVSHIVNAHGGTIELESEEGSGSTFRLVLPAGT